MYKMKVAIIGAGFTGLAATYELVCLGAEVKIFEGNLHPGGLAGGFFHDGWAWPLEHHYHHGFETDKALKKWLTDLGLGDRLFYRSTRSFSLTQNYLAELDTPLSLLSFPGLSLMGKIRTGIVLAGLKLWPWGKFLERYTAKEFLVKGMGQESWKKLWEPLFLGKFADQADKVNMAWFWARIFAQSKKLGYFDHGFLGLTEEVTAKLTEMGAEFQFGYKITSIEKIKNGFQVVVVNSEKKAKEEKELFDKVLFTGNSQQLLELAGKQFPKDYYDQLDQLQSLAAMTLVLVLDQPFFNQDIYWLNINKKNWPFLAVVEHTRFIDSQKYANQHLVYVGKYLDAQDHFFASTKEEVLKRYDQYLEQLAIDYKKHISASYLFKDKFAQPVVGKMHSLRVPKISTPLQGLYFAGMEHVYPYDRGINYAIQLGRETAKSIFQQN